MLNLLTLYEVLLILQSSDPSVNILDTLGHCWEKELSFLYLKGRSELLQQQLFILLKGNFAYFPSYIDDNNTFILDLIHFILDYMIKYVDINENLIWNKEKNYVESNWKDLMDFFIIDNPFVLASEYHFNCKYSEDFIINR